MAVYRDGEADNVAGFLIQKTASGQIRASARNDVSVPTLLSSLNQLEKAKDLVEISLENFSPDGLDTTGEDATHKRLAQSLLPFLFKGQVVRIVLPQKWLHCVKGMCQGMVTDSVRQVTGPSVDIHSVQVNIRDVIMNSEKFSKFVCPEDAAGFVCRIRTAAEVLTEVQTMLDIPYILVSRIYSAHKHIRRLRSTANMKLDEDHDSASTLSSTDEDMDLSDSVRSTLGQIRHCYCCKKKYSFPDKVETLDTAWKQYPAMCSNCAVYNYRKRYQSTDLRRKYAVVTGGRIKIGYHVVLKLLRDGCHVIATTRFPRDAATRFQRGPKEKRTSSCSMTDSRSIPWI